MPDKIKISIDPLNIKDINKMIRYFDREWVRKLDKLGERIAKRLTDEGKMVVYGVLAQHMDTGETFSSLTVRHDGEGVYTIYGNSTALLFLEFGSGVRGKASEQSGWNDDFHMGAGTFPGQRNALNPNGWAFPTGEVDEDGNKIYRQTKGHPAYKPFYNAYKTMDQHLEQIVREEFDPSDFS